MDSSNTDQRISLSEGALFYDLLCRLIGSNEAARALNKICRLNDLDAIFHGEVTNAEALAFYVYSTAAGWHSRINVELWSGAPSPEVIGFAEVLNAGLSKLVPIKGPSSTVFRGYSTDDLEAFILRYTVGEVVEFPGFTSASFKETGAFGGNVLFIIRALTARAIWFLSPNFHEEEALLPTGCRFRVVDQQVQEVANRKIKLVLVLQEIV